VTFGLLSLDFTHQQFEEITSIDHSTWITELSLHAELFEKFDYHLPSELKTTKAQLEKRLST
jgi:phosphoenolpyruvate carboxykinase (GTP)